LHSIHWGYVQHQADPPLRCLDCQLPESATLALVSCFHWKTTSPTNSDYSTVCSYSCSTKSNSADLLPYDTNKPTVHWTTSYPNGSIPTHSPSSSTTPPTPFPRNYTPTLLSIADHPVLDNASAMELTSFWPNPQTTVHKQHLKHQHAEQSHLSCQQHIGPEEQAEQVCLGGLMSCPTILERHRTSFGTCQQYILYPQYMHLLWHQNSAV